MSMLYRAVWSDIAPESHSGAISRLRTCTAGWVQESDEPAPLEDGLSEFEVSQERNRQVSVRSIGSEAFEVTATDRIPGDSTEWVTRIRAVADDEGVHTLVELSMSSDDLARRVSVGRPKIVHELLEAAKKPRIGGSGVLTESLALPANGIDILTDMLANPRRTLPVIVCAEPKGSHDGAWLRTAGSIAARAEGVAVVITLDRSAVKALWNEFGSLAIWDGGVRVYTPGVVTAESEGWRHRYYLRSRLEESPRATVDRIVYSVTQLSTRRRVPEAFRIFGEQHGLPADALDGMIPAKELLDAREHWEFELELARDEQSALERSSPTRTAT